MDAGVDDRLRRLEWLWQRRRRWRFVAFNGERVAEQDQGAVVIAAWVTAGEAQEDAETGALHQSSPRDLHGGWEDESSLSIHIHLTS